MIASYRTTLISFCLLIIFCFAPNKFFAVESGKAAQPTTVTAMGDTEEEHESDGPEGTRGVPMQKPSIAQITLVLIVLAGGGVLVHVNRNRRHPLES